MQNLRFVCQSGVEFYFAEKKHIIHPLLHAPAYAHKAISAHQSVESPLLEVHFISVSGEEARHI